MLIFDHSATTYSALDVSHVQRESALVFFQDVLVWSLLLHCRSAIDASLSKLFFGASHKDWIYIHLDLKFIFLDNFYGEISLFA